MRVFKARLRRVGNSLGVLVPKAVADEAGASEGKEVQVAIMPVETRRRKLLQELAGSAPNLAPFEREDKDRF